MRLTQHVRLQWSAAVREWVALFYGLILLLVQPTTHVELIEIIFSFFLFLNHSYRGLNHQLCSCWRLDCRTQCCLSVLYQSWLVSSNSYGCSHICAVNCHYSCETSLRGANNVFTTVSTGWEMFCLRIIWDQVFSFVSFHHWINPRGCGFW